MTRFHTEHLRQDAAAKPTQPDLDRPQQRAPWWQRLPLELAIVFGLLLFVVLWLLVVAPWL